MYTEETPEQKTARERAEAINRATAVVYRHQRKRTRRRGPTNHARPYGSKYTRSSGGDTGRVYFYHATKGWRSIDMGKPNQGPTLMDRVLARLDGPIPCPWRA